MCAKYEVSWTAGVLAGGKRQTFRIVQQTAGEDAGGPR
jgi:hypothetical protein